MRRSLALVLAASLALLGCSDDDTTVGTGGTAPPDSLPVIPAVGAASEQERLDAALARWEANGPADYVWTYSVSCFCPLLTVTATVVDGEVVDFAVDYGESEDPNYPHEEPEILTMDALFAEAQSAIDTADEVTVEYEPADGRITTMTVDAIRNAVDDEYAYTVSRFVPADPGSSSSSTTSTTGATIPNEGSPLDGAPLTEAWGCGYGFRGSNAEQTVGLFVEYVGPNDGGAYVTNAGVTELPDEQWEVRLDQGTDLFANWCDDVIESGEATAEVEQSWPIVAGTMTFLTDPPVAGSIEMSTQRVGLSGLVAERPDGSTVTLGDAELVNESWGVFAG